MAVRKACPKHPKYKGDRQPRVVCDYCVDIYLHVLRKKTSVGR